LGRNFGVRKWTVESFEVTVISFWKATKKRYQILSGAKEKKNEKQKVCEP
jgi:hypothetical protein